jgi:ribonuclease G
VLSTLRNALDRDRTKTYVVEISPLGLVEMTRQNVTDGVREILTKLCPTCEGEGVVLSEETVALQVERKLRDLAAERTDAEAFLIQAHPRVVQILLGGPGRPLLELEEEVGKHFHFEGGEGLPLDHFALSLAGTRAEVEERALPFREGEEIHVAIEEPHMYDEDYAVAKIDGYVISVAGAGGLVGEKRLVRIEQVGRRAAAAVLVDSDGAAGADRGGGRARGTGGRSGAGGKGGGRSGGEPAAQASKRGRGSRRRRRGAKEVPETPE